MIRLAAWFRRSRPSVGGPVGPAPLDSLSPDPYTTPWHMQQAHAQATLARVEYGRWLIGRARRHPVEVADMARHAAHHLLAFAAGLEADTVPVDVPDDPRDLTGGA